jgi:3-oxoacyl-[acyl-carrier-protein] synthase III
MESTHRNVKIVGIATSLPSQIVSSNDSTFFLSEDVEKITENLGFLKRRVVNTDTCTSDLCFFAANKLLETLEIQRENIDGIIFVSQTPDYILPATAFLLQQRLGLAKTCFAFDVNLGCSGYVYGLWLASNLIQGGAKNVLVLAGDTISKLIAPSDRATAFVFGDAGSATLVSYNHDSPLIHTVIGSDGSGSANLCVPKGGFRNPMQHNNLPLEQPSLFMDGSEVFAFTLREVPKMMRALLDRAGITLDQVEKCFLHQANQFMLNHLGKRMKIPSEKLVIMLEGIGNTSSASIPISISEYKRLNPENSIGLSVLAGFGVGWSWAGMIADLSKTLILPTLEYQS